jgi:hypothetical protein
MSKFTFVIEIKNGKPLGTAFTKEDAAVARAMFDDLREKGKEAYFFQHPQPDKRCKSTEQMAASRGTESTGEVAPVETAKPLNESVDQDMEVIKNSKYKKNSVGGLS